MIGTPQSGWRRRAGAKVSLLAAAAALCLATSAWAEPQIQHNPPSPQPKSDILIRAKITAAGGVLEPYLYFRKPGGEFTRVALKQKGDHYDARIPAEFLEGVESIEYYLAAFAGKDLSHGFWHSEKSPYKLSMKGKGERNRTIHIKTRPDNAIVDVDGETVGAAPYTAELPPGPHHVNARLPGYGHVEFDFTMPKEKDLDLPLTLVADQGAAKPEPTAVVNRPAALVSPPPPPAPPADKPAVVHSVAPEAPPPLMPLPEDSAPATVKPPTALAAETPPPAAPAPPAAKPPPDGTGHVSVITDPPGATIAVDGKGYGPSPASIDLLPGDYLLSANLTGFKEGSRVLNVKAGDHIDKSIKLKPAQ